MDLTPGEYAMMTGLSAKALRLYAERGILTPASVDPVTGYRQYARAQLQQGMVTDLLRRAKVPLSELGSGPDFAFSHWREQVEMRRHMEDFYLSLAERVAVFDPATFTPHAVEAPAVDWIGVEIALDVPDDVEGMIQTFAGLAVEAPQVYAAFAEALDEFGVPGSDVCWTATPEGSPREPRMLMARPVAVPVGAVLVEKRVLAATGRRLTVSTGTLPRRQEITFTSVTDSDDILDEAASGHLQLLAFEGLRRDRDLTPVGAGARVVVRGPSPYASADPAAATNVFDVVSVL